MSEFFSSNPDVLCGKLVFAGTRIAVDFVRELIEAGESIDDVLLDYPQLSREAVEAAIGGETQ